MVRDNTRQKYEVDGDAGGQGQGLLKRRVVTEVVMKRFEFSSVFSREGERRGMKERRERSDRDLRTIAAA